MFTEFGVIILVTVSIVLVALVAVLIYATRTLGRLGNRIVDTLDRRLGNLEEQHAAILLRIDQYQANGRREGAAYGRNLATAVGQLIDEYNQLLLYANDPADKHRYTQKIAELKAKMAGL